MKVSDVMTRKVVSVAPEASMTEAVRLKLQHRVSGLPVVDRNEQLVGIITEGDLLRRTETGTEKHRARWIEFVVGPGRLAEEYARAHARKVGEIMTTDLTTVSEDTPLESVVELMEKRHIKRVPVLRDGKVVGIVSRANLLRALARSSSEVEATPVDDNTL